MRQLTTELSKPHLLWVKAVRNIFWPNNSASREELVLDMSHKIKAE